MWHFYTLNRYEISIFVKFKVDCSDHHKNIGTFVAFLKKLSKKLKVDSCGGVNKIIKVVSPPAT